MTLSLPFIGIQLGLFAVATAASTWAAHPFQAQWKAAARAVRHASRGYRAARRRAGRASWRRQQARCPAAHLREQGRQRRVGSPVGRDTATLPVQARLCPRGFSGAWLPRISGSRWPSPDCPGEVLDLLEYPDRIRKGSNLEPLESVNLDDLDAAWENLQRQLRDEADAARRAGEERRLPPGSTYSSYTLNGASREASAPERATACPGTVNHEPGSGTTGCAA